MRVGLRSLWRRELGESLPANFLELRGMAGFARKACEPIAD